MAKSNLIGTYIPDEVTITISNSKFTHVVTGVASDTFINIERTTPATSSTEGADGSVMRVKRRIRNCTFTLTLLQGSNSNDIFSQLQKNDENSNFNDWLFSILVKDNSGRSYHYSDQAYVVNDPTVPYSTDATTREWAIQAYNVVSEVNGNSPFLPDEITVLEGIGKVIPPSWKK